MLQRVRFLSYHCNRNAIFDGKRAQRFSRQQETTTTQNHENEKAVSSHPILGCEHLRYSAILMLAVVGHLLACCLSRVLNASF